VQRGNRNGRYREIAGHAPRPRIDSAAQWPAALQPDECRGKCQQQDGWHIAATSPARRQAPWPTFTPTFFVGFIEIASFQIPVCRRRRKAMTDARRDAETEDPV
jgi:hypothetical protein